MKTKSFSNRTVQIAFGSAIAILLVVGAVSYRSIVVSRDRDKWVQHTNEVLTNLQDLRFDMQTINATVRGFGLTGDESFIEPYHAAVANMEQHQAIIGNLTVDNPVQQSQLPALEKWEDARIQRAETIIKVRRTQGLEAVAENVRTGPSAQISNNFQAVANQMRDEELRLLAIRTGEEKRSLRQSRAILIFGTLLGLLITAAAGWMVQRDSARRGLAEQAFRDGEEKYRTLLYEVQEYAVFTLDPQGRVLTWNAGAERIKGYSADQIIGRDFSCFFVPEDVKRGRPQELLRLTAASGRHEEQCMRVRQDGSQYLANVTFTALRDSAGELQGFSEISRDLSETKESGAKYRGLLEAAPDAMVVVNPGGEIVLLNVRAEKQFGYRRDELIGQKVTNIIPKGFAERLVADGTRSVEDALAQQIGTGIELVGLRKDKSEFPLELMLSPLESAEGILVTAAIRDISVRKTAEAHLLQKLVELSRSNEELGQFAYIASHDLQEPLRMVASYTQLLSKRYKGKLDADADQFIEFAVDGANRMQRLIRDLLIYSRVGSKGMTLRDTSGEEALQQALTNLHGAVKDSGAVVTHDPLPAVMADETQLVQLLQNLVGNAIKYQGPGIPRIHVSAAKNGGEKWMFSVKDNGLGIDPKYFEKIFGMFQRLHKREEFAGTGIGLAICKKIAERHGGGISVESAPGNGSTFRFDMTGSEKSS